MDSTADFPLLWRPLAFGEDAAFRWCLAGAEFTVRRRGVCWNSMCRPIRWEKRRTGEWAGPEAVPGSTGADDSADIQDISGEAPEYGSAVWGESSGQVTAVLAPRMEERPFLVCPAEKLRIFPGMEARLDTALPPVLQLSAPKNTGSSALSGGALFTARPFILKETWYGGTAMKGMLCLSLPVNGPEETEGNAIIRCSVLIRNKSKTALELENFPLHAAELSLYEAGGKLLSETPVIDTYGNGDFHIGFMPPETFSKDVPPALLAAGNKSDAWDTLFHQGSRIIKHITGL